jgi:hypothetical protein
MSRASRTRFCWTGRPTPRCTTRTVFFLGRLNQLVCHFAPNVQELQTDKAA